jgi:hypothetical protein
MDNAFAAGDRFLLLQARLLERRLFATYFLGQPSGRVIDVLRGYQNDDGGFGHSLEPDTRCPASLPVYVESALQAMVMGGTVDPWSLPGPAIFWPRWRPRLERVGECPWPFP